MVLLVNKIPRPTPLVDRPIKFDRFQDLYLGLIENKNKIIDVPQDVEGTQLLDNATSKSKAKAKSKTTTVASKTVTKTPNDNIVISKDKGPPPKAKINVSNIKINQYKNPNIIFDEDNVAAKDANGVKDVIIPKSRDDSRVDNKKTNFDDMLDSSDEMPVTDMDDREVPEDYDVNEHNRREREKMGTEFFSDEDSNIDRKGKDDKGKKDDKSKNIGSTRRDNEGTNSDEDRSRRKDRYSTVDDKRRDKDFASDIPDDDLIEPGIDSMFGGDFEDDKEEDVFNDIKIDKRDRYNKRDNDKRTSPDKRSSSNKDYDKDRDGDRHRNRDDDRHRDYRRDRDNDDDLIDDDRDHRNRHSDEDRGNDTTDIDSANDPSNIKKGEKDDDKKDKDTDNDEKNDESKSNVQGGAFGADPYEGLNEDEKMAKQKEEYSWKIFTLKKSYGDKYEIPDVNQFDSLEDIKKKYDKSFKEITLSEKLVSYQQYFTYAVYGIQFVCTNLMGINLEGFADQQLVMRDQYNAMLIELGEKSYTSFSMSLPVEIRLLGFVIFNAGIFWLTSKMGFSGFSQPSSNPIHNGGGNSGNFKQSQPQQQKVMKGPSFDDDFDDDQEDDVKKKGK
jgi:hypothetical protein